LTIPSSGSQQARKQSKAAMKILLINSTPMIRQELSLLLKDQPDIQSIEEAEDNDTGLRMVEKLSPEVVVLDFQNSFQDSAETVKRMLALKPSLKIIALSMYSDRRYLDACLQAGVCGYLLKDCAYEELLDAVRSVASDRQYLSRSIRLRYV
jgi:two-component system response regulator NreC